MTMNRVATESRTGKSLHNSVVALLMYLLHLTLQFFSRKIFLEYLGADVLGLNTTAMNLLQFLNLAELGIGSAIAFTLYKPLAENDRGSINEILAVQGWLYRRIAYFVIAGALILMCFFPLIFAKITLPLWYAYASFAVLLFSSLLSYFINYKQVLLSADQREYKVQMSYKLTMLLKMLVQIIVISQLSHGYVWWLIIEAAFAVFASIAVNVTVKRTYPYLSSVAVNGRMIKEKYSVIVTKIKQLFFHKIGSFVLTQTSPIIIYAYTTLAMVARYGNYMLVINGFTLLLQALFNSMAGGVGNLIASGNRERMFRVFRELFSLRFILIFTLCIVIYYVTPLFVTIWIGSEYILPRSTLLLMIGVFYIMTSRLTVDAYVNGFGLYGDIWSPVAEGVINIVLSVILGARYGLNGVVGGVLISLICTMLIWKPYYLFTRKLKGYLKLYIIDYLKHIVAGALTLIAVGLFVGYIGLNTDGGIRDLVLYSLELSVITAVCLTVLLLAFGCGIRFFVVRLKKMLVK